MINQATNLTTAPDLMSPPPFPYAMLKECMDGRYKRKVAPHHPFNIVLGRGVLVNVTSAKTVVKFVDELTTFQNYRY